MTHPPLEEFQAVAKPGALVPIYEEIVADLETPVSAYLKVCEGRPYAFLLESVERADTVGRYSFLGADASVVFRSKGTQCAIIRDGKEQPFTSDDPMGELRTLMAEYEAVPMEGLPEFHGGAVGYVSYDQIRFVEQLPDENPDDLELPDLYFMITDTILIFDHVNNTLKIVSNVHTGDDPIAAYDEGRVKIAKLKERLQAPLQVPKLAKSAPAAAELPESNFSKEAYCAAVERAKEYIRAGDIFQVVLSQRFKRETTCSPVTLYRALRCINPSPYMTLVQFPDCALVGSSPEVMTAVTGRKCRVRPIAGTRPRGANAQEDRAFAEDLLADEKELAEHIMLVDLGRNDVGRVSKPGTVSPTQLMVIERYSHVMHIVSDVVGELVDDADAIDALNATFPMGTVSGAPKIRAMEIIDELEPVRRGPYSGGCGYISFSGDMDTCIVIRTLVIKGDTAYIQAGAGIVYDSVPEREYEECINKAKALFRAIDFAERGLES
jgi:anthranilate synthase component I